jgi:periplasmic protein TonB
MFEQTFVNAQVQTRRPWTVAVSLALQTALVAVLLIAPLLHIAKLDAPPKVPLFLQVEKVNLQAKPEVKSAPQVSTAPRPVFHLSALQPPRLVPSTIDMTPDPPQIGVTTPITTGPSLGGLVSEIPAQAPPKPPAPIPTVAVQPTAPIHVGGDVEAAKLISAPRPSYPSIARAARVQGTVKIQATIARDGSIRNLQLISGPPLLVAVALEAVGRWRYQPTLLNGQPVEVITEIAVNFTLSQ